MLYVKDTDKSVAAALASLEEAVARHGFGVLHSYDLKATLEAKGHALAHACHILEVCNPAKAAAVMADDMSMNVALPCRISVWEEGGRTHVGMIRPSHMLALLGGGERLADVAQEVEAATVAMIDEAVAS